MIKGFGSYFFLATRSYFDSRLQVQELHRVYSLQKKLMQQLEKVMVSQAKETTDTDEPKFALCLEPKTQTGQNFFGARDDDHDKINGHKSRMKRKLDLEIPDDQAAATTRSSVNPSEDRQKDSLRRSDEGEEETDVQVELTLSIGHNCTRKQQIRSKEQPVDGSCSSSSSKKTNKGEDLEARSVISSSTSSVYQENNTRPHWLFQDLSLNRT